MLRECGAPLGRFENPRRLAENEGLRDPCPVQVEQESRALAQQLGSDARLSLDALRGLIARLGEIEGPKTLVLLSEGLVAEPQLIDLTALGAAAQAARVTIYVLQLETPVLRCVRIDTVSPTLYRRSSAASRWPVRLAGSAKRRALPSGRRGSISVPAHPARAVRLLPASRSRRPTRTGTAGRIASTYRRTRADA